MNQNPSDPTEAPAVPTTPVAPEVPPETAAETVDAAEATAPGVAAEPAEPAVAAEPAEPAITTEPSEPAAPSPATPEPGEATVDLSPAATAKKLAELFPPLFGREVKPIKLRIHADIQQRAPGIFTRKALSAFLHRHTTSTAYLKALVAAATRFDLDGQPAGEALEEHREAARHELARRRQLAEVRRAAERQSARAAAQEAERLAQEQRHEQIKAERKARKEAAREWARKKAEGLAADIEAERQRAETEAQYRERRERAVLLRAWETTTLTRANFLVLKRISGEELDRAVAQAREEARSMPPPQLTERPPVNAPRQKPPPHRAGPPERRAPDSRSRAAPREPARPPMQAPSSADASPRPEGAAAPGSPSQP